MPRAGREIRTRRLGAGDVVVTTQLSHPSSRLQSAGRSHRSRGRSVPEVFFYFVSVFLFFSTRFSRGHREKKSGGKKKQLKVKKM